MARVWVEPLPPGEEPRFEVTLFGSWPRDCALDVALYPPHDEADENVMMGYFSENGPWGGLLAVLEHVMLRPPGNGADRGGLAPGSVALMNPGKAGRAALKALLQALAQSAARLAAPPPPQFPPRPPSLARGYGEPARGREQPSAGRPEYYSERPLLAENSPRVEYLTSVLERHMKNNGAHPSFKDDSPRGELKRLNYVKSVCVSHGGVTEGEAREVSARLRERGY